MSKIVCNGSFNVVLLTDDGMAIADVVVSKVVDSISGMIEICWADPQSLDKPMTVTVLSKGEAYQLLDALKQTVKKL